MKTQQANVIYEVQLTDDVMLKKIFDGPVNHYIDIHGPNIKNITGRIVYRTQKSIHIESAKYYIIIFQQTKFAYFIDIELNNGAFNSMSNISDYTLSG